MAVTWGQKQTQKPFPDRSDAKFDLWELCLAVVYTHFWTIFESPESSFGNAVLNIITACSPQHFTTYLQRQQVHAGQQ